MTKPERSSILNSVANRLFMRQARIVSTKSFGTGFRLLRLASEQLKGIRWTPGQKLQVGMGSVLTVRSYTPFDVDTASGELSLLAALDASGPGTEWAQQASSGEICHVFGPRDSIDIATLGPSILMVGDETSIGLSLSARNLNAPPIRLRHLFEAQSPDLVIEVADVLGLTDVHVISKPPDHAHLDLLGDKLVSMVDKGDGLTLTGRAATIQYLRGRLKARDLIGEHVETKAYWAPGKTGLD